MKLQFCNLERNKICLRQNTKNEALPIFDSVKDLIQSKVHITMVNFSRMSPKLVRTYPHIVENRRITMAPLFLRFIS